MPYLLHLKCLPVNQERRVNFSNYFSAIGLYCPSNTRKCSNTLWVDTFSTNCNHSACYHWLYFSIKHPIILENVYIFNCPQPLSINCSQIQFLKWVLSEIKLCGKSCPVKNVSRKCLFLVYLLRRLFLALHMDLSVFGCFLLVSNFSLENSAVGFSEI